MTVATQANQKEEKSLALSRRLSPTSLLQISPDLDLVIRISPSLLQISPDLDLGGHQDPARRHQREQGRDQADAEAGEDEGALLLQNHEFILVSSFLFMLAGENEGALLRAATVRTCHYALQRGIVLGEDGGARSYAETATLSSGSHTRNGHPFRSSAWLIPSTAVSIDPSFPRSAFS